MPFDSISAVLPAYDEEENIEKATRDMAAVLASHYLAALRYEEELGGEFYHPSDGRVADW